MRRFIHLCAIVCCLWTVGAFAQSSTGAGAANAAGRLIYIRSCAICHGMGLQGRDANWQLDSVFVPPLGASGKAWRMTDGQLQAMLQDGVHAAPSRLPAMGMPPFAGRLDDQQIGDVIAYLKEQWTQPERDHQAQATQAAALPAELRAQFGAQLYVVKCAICHGAKLEGLTQRIGAPGQERSVRVPPLKHDILAQAMSDAMLRGLIIEGETHHPIPHSEYRMPDMRVSDEEANALVLYLRQVWQGKAP